MDLATISARRVRVVLGAGLALVVTGLAGVGGAEIPRSR